MQHFRSKRIKTLNFNAFVKTPGDKLSFKGTYDHLIINYKKTMTNLKLVDKYYGLQSSINANNP